MTRSRLLPAALFAALLPATVLADGEVVIVEMVDNEFVPEKVEITTGTTVRWENVERRNNHDVYFADEDIASPRLFPEDSWERTFDEPGTYDYICRPHEDRGMKGVVHVTDD